MSKKKNKRNNKKSKIQGKADPKQPQPQLPQPVPPINKGHKWKIWGWIGGVAALVTIVLAVPAIRNLLLTDQARNDHENFYQGDLRPEKLRGNQGQANGYRQSETPPNFTLTAVNDSFPKIIGLRLRSSEQAPDVKFIMSGSGFFATKEDLKKGIWINMVPDTSLFSGKMTFGLVDDRLYISVEFKDLQKEETIGVIEFNHWKLYKSNLFDFKNDDNRLEVRDKQHNIVFTIKIELTKAGTDVVKIAGYFVGPSSILVLSNTGSNQNFNIIIPKSKPNYKSEVWKEIVKIKSNF